MSLLLALVEEESVTVAPLHGRRVRGRRVYFPDELDPVVEAETAQQAVNDVEVPTLPSLAPIAAQIEAAKLEAQAFLARIAAERKARAEEAALAALMAKFDAVMEGIEAYKAREALIVQRLRDEDELILLAL